MRFNGTHGRQSGIEGAIKDMAMTNAVWKHVWVRAALLATALAVTGTGAAQAQSLVASINGDPITSVDVEERIKFLRVLRKPATRETALEDLYGERLKLRETAKYGINATESDINAAANLAAQAAKLDVQAVLGGWQRAGVSSQHIQGRLRADAAFSIYVRARNRVVEPSETEVRAELAARGKTAKGSDFKLRQVIFILPSGAGPGIVAQRGREAQQFRGRFTDCATGPDLARTLPDVAVKDEFIRNSIGMNDGLRKLLESTPIGHLTPPQREQNGIAMVAVCSKTDATDDANARESVSGTILARKLEGSSDQLYKDLRARAVIEKR